MSKRPLFILQFYYTIILLVLVLGPLGGLYFYWNTKLIDTNYVATVHETLYNIASITKEDQLNKVADLMARDRVRESIKVFESIEKKYREVILLTSTPHKDMEGSLQKVKNNFDKLISYPQFSMVVVVLGQKLDQFNEYVSQNNWKTLSRVGLKLKSMVYLNKDVSSKKWPSIISSIKYNTKFMVSVVETPAVSETDRNIIKEKIDSIEFELDIISKYMSDLQVSTKDFSQFKDSFDIFIQKEKNALLLEKIRIQERNKEFVFFFSLFCGGAVLSLIFGFILYAAMRRYLQAAQEKSVIHLIQSELLSLKANFHGIREGKFLDEIKKMHSYIQKRMGLGLLFQEALPFPAILLDSNLKVVWSNAYFCECFKLNQLDAERESFSWDYLSKFTNLGDSNPVLDSHHSGDSGIYQIKIRPDQNGDLLPYEMYVRPINQNGQKSVMVFLYPLIYMEEVIRGQSQSLVAPISKVLDHILQNSFDDKKKESLREDFSLVGIPDLFDQLITVNEFYILQRQGLLKEIDDLENEIKDHYKLLADINIQNREYKKIQVEILDIIQYLKNGIISYVDFVGSYLKSADDLCISYKDINMNSDIVDYSTEKMGDRLKETKSIVENIIEFKNDLKTTKENMNIANAKLMQLLDKVMIYEQVDNHEVRKMCGLLSKIRSEILASDKEMENFFNHFKGLDLKVSKLLMLIKDNENDLSHIHQVTLNKTALLDNLEEKSFKKSSFAQDYPVHEDKMVKNLEHFFSIYRKNLSYFKDLSDLVSKFLDKETKNETQQKDLFTEINFS